MNPIRINKFLADHGHASRRGADQLIAGGKVLVNGAPAVLGMMVSEKDVVEVLERKPVKVVAFYKPLGKPTRLVGTPAEKDGDLFPLLDLEKESSGLVVFTNDGRITSLLQKPTYPGIENRYELHVSRAYAPSLVKLFEQGMLLADRSRTPAAKVQQLDDTTLAITLRETRPTPLRFMCAELGLTATRIERTHSAGVSLKGLSQGIARRLGHKEVAAFLEQFR